MRTATCVLVLILAGCGGGGTGPTPQAACVPAQVTIQLFGDSTMAADIVPQTLQAILDVRFGRGNTLVTNRAVPGSTSEQFITGTDTLNQPWPASVSAKIIVVNHGINDMTHEGGAGVPAYRERMRLLATTSPAKLIFETPNRVTGRDVGPWAEAMREIGAQYKIPVADTYSRTVELADWAHPTEAGYVSVVTDSLAPVVVPVVASMRCE